MNNYQALQTDLAKAKATNPTHVDLDEVKIVPVGDLVDLGYTPGEVISIDEEYMYLLDTTWSFSLEDILITWYTDYDFASGAFENYTKDDKATLEELNAIMDVIDALEWRNDLANYHIKAIDERYTNMLPKVISVLQPYTFNQVVEAWLDNKYPKFTFSNILELVEEQSGKEERQEVAMVIADLATLDNISPKQAQEELDSFNGTTFIY